LEPGFNRLEEFEHPENHRPSLKAQTENPAAPALEYRWIWRTRTNAHIENVRRFAPDGRDACRSTPDDDLYFRVKGAIIKRFSVAKIALCAASERFGKAQCSTGRTPGSG
jgi:hypothetical protein